VIEQVGEVWARDTHGNPFFIRELLRHLIEVGKPEQSDRHWITEQSLRKFDVPPGVRDVLVRRLSLLSGAANQFLSTAAAFEGMFRFDVVAQVAQLAEDESLDALDESLNAQILQPAEASGTYVFTHTLMRQTVYDGLNPSRQERLHRRVAEALEAAYTPQPTRAQSGEIAAHFHRSAGLPGGERGVDYAIAAATHAERTGAHDDAARFLRAALKLLPQGDERRSWILGRLWLALAWAATFDEALALASEDWEAIAAVEGEEAASEHLAEAVTSCLESAERMAALKVIGLLDGPPRPEFDQLTAEAAHRLGAAYSLITLIDDHRQFFVSSYGLPEEVLPAGVRETPLEYSFCKYVAAFAAPLQINNSLTHPLARDNPTTTAVGVRCYLGVPLRTKMGHALGSICVGDFSARQWQPEDQRVLEELGQRAMAVAEPEG
jgi:GAF domain.